MRIVHAHFGIFRNIGHCFKNYKWPQTHFPLVNILVIYPTFMYILIY